MAADLGHGFVDSLQQNISPAGISLHQMRDALPGQLAGGPRRLESDLQYSSEPLPTGAVDFAKMCPARLTDASPLGHLPQLVALTAENSFSHTEQHLLGCREEREGLQLVPSSPSLSPPFSPSPPSLLSGLAT